MAIEFKLPNLGENIESGDIVNVLVKEGDELKANQGVVEIETDKAVIEVPTSTAGRVAKVHVRQGQTVKIGESLLTLEPVGAEGGRSAQPAKTSAAAAAQPAKSATAAKPVAPAGGVAAKGAAAAKGAEPRGVEPRGVEPGKPAQAPASVSAKAGGSKATGSKAGGNGQSVSRETPAGADVAEDEGVGSQSSLPDPAGPAVRRLARELGVELSLIKGSGPDGRIVREDVIAAVRQANASGVALGHPDAAAEHDSFGPISREGMSRIRKTIAANMVHSATTIPQLTNFDDADITELEQWRKDTLADYETEKVKLTSTAFVLRAVALSLRRHRAINASLDMESGQIIYKQYVNIGVAVDTDRGLVVPVLRDVDRMTIKEIARSLSMLAEKARNSQTALEEMRGGTFTISNLGSIGGVYSTPIVNPPEVAILLIGRARKLPVVTEEDRIEPRLMMPLSLSYDHRLVDGAAAARFLNEVIDYLESPRRLLLA